MMAPGGIASPGQRMPTVWTVLPSVTSSRSLLVRYTVPPANSSASSLDVAVRLSTTEATAVAGRSAAGIHAVMMASIAAHRGRESGSGRRAAAVGTREGVEEEDAGR